MFRVKSMVIVMVATLVMGFGFSAVAIMHAGTPQDAVDASKMRQSYLAEQRAASPTTEATRQN